MTGTQKILFIVGMLCIFGGGFGISYALSLNGRGDDWFSASVMLIFGIIFIALVFKGQKFKK